MTRWGASISTTTGAVTFAISGCPSKVWRWLLSRYLRESSLGNSTMRRRIVL